mmetsp:Transcript_4167/g.4868  ORF Transcript_4167/g.4868 Transcript_4167/m.4868 type:complete len:200 (-) Transcript_4167:2271-2870(-)
MGNRISFRIPKYSKPVPILFIGLDGSGKTSILKKLSQREQDITGVFQLVPTNGVSKVPLLHNGYKLVAYDLGGKKSNRQNWRDYFRFAQTIVFVIDSSDRKRMEENGVELLALLQHEDLIGVPLLVYANKQDLFNSVSAKEISEGLNLHLIRGRLWQIQPCSAQTGDGIQPAFEWIIQTLAERTLSVKQLIRNKSRVVE